MDWSVTLKGGEVAHPRRTRVPTAVAAAAPIPLGPPAPVAVPPLAPTRAAAVEEEEEEEVSDEAPRQQSLRFGCRCESCSHYFCFSVRWLINGALYAMIGQKLMEHLVALFKVM